MPAASTSSLSDKSGQHVKCKRAYREVMCMQCRALKQELTGFHKRVNAIGAFLRRQLRLKA